MMLATILALVLSGGADKDAAALQSATVQAAKDVGINMVQARGLMNNIRIERKNIPDYCAGGKWPLGCSYVGVDVNTGEMVAVVWYVKGNSRQTKAVLNHELRHAFLMLLGRNPDFH